MNKTIAFLLITTFFIGCKEKESKNTTKEQTNAKQTVIKNQYAEHFTIKYENNYILLEVHNPWVDAENVNYTYAIATHPKAKLPENTIHIDKIPTRVAAISSTHIAFIEAIDELKSINAISNTQYVYNNKIKTEHANGNISEIGYDTNLNIEKLLQLKTEVIFLYGLSNEIEPLRKKLLRVGITPIMIGEYTENHPLGKAEWIKVFGLIYNKTKKANQVYDSIANEYLRLKKLVANIDNKPTVFTSMPWNDVWNTPGAKTFTAQLISDAGGIYVFANDTATINYTYDTEIVFQRAGNADIWINTGVAENLKQIENTDKRMKLFKAFSDKNVFNSNARSISGGASDYMESGTVNPHITLADLIEIFHPKILNHNLYYYQRLQ